MTQQKVERYDPTEPLHKIDEESGDVLLNEVVELAVKPLYRQTRNGDDSPLERLLQSISSDEQWTVDEEDDAVSGRLKNVKAYHDPGRMTDAGITQEHWNDVEEENDSGDEVNASPAKKEPDDLGVGATITSIMLFRYLFGKRKAAETKRFRNQSLSSEDEENDVRYRVVEVKNDSPKDISIKTKDPGAAEREEIAVNLPIIILEKLKKVFSKTSSGNADALNMCPLCGQDMSGVRYGIFEDRVKRAKLWRILWVDPNADLDPSAPKGTYKTELRIDADGNQSLYESFHREAEGRKRVRVDA